MFAGLYYNYVLYILPVVLFIAMVHDRGAYIMAYLCVVLTLPGSLLALLGVLIIGALRELWSVCDTLQRVAVVVVIIATITAAAIMM